MEKFSISKLKNNDSAMFIVLIVACVGVFSAFNPGFCSVDSFYSIGKQFPEIGLFTFAMMLPMLVGGIDLSVIASANLATILMSMYMTSHTPGVFTLIISILICVLVCLIVGLLNGLIVAAYKIPAMLVTLGMQMVLTGIGLGITKGTTLSNYPDTYKFIGNGYIFLIPTQLWIFLIASIVLIIIMQKTSFGIKLQMYGSSKIATQYSGISEMAVLVKTYLLSGLYVSIAAIVMSSRLTSASAGAASSYLMRAILIAVLGGVDPNGGKGRVPDVIWAVILFQVVATGLNVLRVNSYVVITFYGLILLLSVFVRTRRNR